MRADQPFAVIVANDPVFLADLAKRELPFGCDERSSRPDGYQDNSIVRLGNCRQMQDLAVIRLFAPGLWETGIALELKAIPVAGNGDDDF